MYSGVMDTFYSTYGEYLSSLPKSKPRRNVPQYARKKEQGRNEKCHCGSNKKYKKCCGY